MEHIVLKYFSHTYRHDKPAVIPQSMLCVTFGVKPTLLMVYPTLAPTEKSLRCSPICAFTAVQTGKSMRAINILFILIDIFF